MAIAAAAPAAVAQTNDGAAQRVQVDAQPLGDALIALSDAFGVTILASEDLVAGKSAPAVIGELSPQQALARALSGTVLEATETEPGTFLVALEAVETVPGRNARAERVDDQVIVTGTRIERTAVNAPSPVDIVTAEDIAAFGLTDTTEALRFVPALNSSVTLSTQGNFQASGPNAFGIASLNLRGLGTNRTLVLVNGRRHVSGVANEASVDISSIPTALIDRVEVLTGGGSSIYGADAVSGVVNYVLKDDFEGVDVRGNVSVPTQGQGEAYFGAVTMGGNFAGGRGNAVLNVEYSRQTEVRISDRSAAQSATRVVQNDPQLASVLGVDPNFRNVLLPDARLGLTAPGPLISFNGTASFNILPFFAGETEFGGFPVEQFIDPSGTLRARNFGAAASSTELGTTLGGDAVPFFFGNPEGSLIPDIERYFINANANYDFTPNINGFIEAKYARNVTESVATFRSLFVADLPISQDNPFIPQQVRDQFASISQQGLNPNLVVTRTFFDEATTGGKKNTRETFRIVGGFKGEVSPALNYEVSANYGRTEISFFDPTTTITDRFNASTDVISDPNTGEPICRSDIDPTAVPPVGIIPPFPGFRSFAPGDGSCAPLNIFAPLNGLDPDAVAFAFLPTEREADLEQLVLNATIRGTTETTFQLPAGAVSYAAGIEYREEKSENRPDQLERQGLFRFGPQDVLGGQFDVFEGFAEVNIPVLANLPFATSLAVDASVRLADYSTAGNATSFAFGTVWQPVNDLRFRASFNRSVRAPNVSELFSPQTVSLDSLAVGSDPCDPNSVSGGSSNRAANCAQLVPNIDTFDPTPSYQPFSVTRIGGGNPDLGVETADTYTVGFALTPSAVPGLSIVADYYNITIQDAIGRPGNRQVILANCADSPTIDNPFCATVTRDPVTGVVTEVREAIANIAESRAQGIDYQIAYSFNLDNLVSSNLGDFTAQLAGTYLIEREDQGFTGFPESSNRLDGELNFPKHFINFALAWNKGRWSADYGFNFSSSQAFGGRSEPFGIEDIEEDPFTLDRPFTGSAFVHFLGGAYQINEDFQISLRVNNLFDRDPFDLRAFESTPRPVSFLGRTVQFGVQANF